MISNNNNIQERVIEVIILITLPKKWTNNTNLFIRATVL